MTNRFFLITSIVRRAAAAEKSGFVTAFSYPDGQILMRSPIVESRFREQDINPRGGLRGARGASFFEDRLVLANAEKIYVLNEKWQKTAEFSHPLMGGIHDVLAGEDGIWVCCTNADLLVRFNWSGECQEIWEWRQEPNLVRRLGFRQLPLVDRHLDYRDPQTMRSGVRNLVHLNSIGRGDRGLLLSFGRILDPGKLKGAKLAGFVGSIARRLGLPSINRGAKNDQIAGQFGSDGEYRGALVRLLAGDETIIERVQSGLHVPNHNIEEVNGNIFYNDTNRNRVVKFSANGETHPAETIKISESPGFLRGMCRVEGEIFLVGSKNPFAVYEVNFHTGRVAAKCELGGCPRESVYGIYAVPRHFSPPPRRLKL